MLLLRNFNKEPALKISFLMSLPVILLGNLLLNIENLFLTPSVFVGIVFSFFFGILSIHILLKMAQRFNFGYFVMTFGLLMLLTVFL